MSQTHGRTSDLWERLGQRGGGTTRLRLKLRWGIAGGGRGTPRNGATFLGTDAGRHLRRRRPTSVRRARGLGGLCTTSERGAAVLERSPSHGERGELTHGGHGHPRWRS